MGRDGKGRPYTYSLGVTSCEFYICVPSVATDVLGCTPCIMDEVERIGSERGEDGKGVITQNRRLEELSSASLFSETF